jgi:hypothetical protein
MSINDLALFPETKARDLLAHAGMKELQQEKKTMECEFFEANGGAAAR